jgi:hypothetical protein
MVNNMIFNVINNDGVVNNMIDNVVCNDGVVNNMTVVMIVCMFDGLVNNMTIVMIDGVVNDMSRTIGQMRVVVGMDLMIVRRISVAITCISVLNNDLLSGSLEMCSVAITCISVLNNDLLSRSLEMCSP